MGPLILLLILCALVYLASKVWNAAEALLQGSVGGVRLFWRLMAPVLRAGLHAARLALAWADVGGLALCRRLHAAYWVYSYRWHRQYIARHIRHRRRARLAH